MRGQRLLDQVDRLPEALDIADRVGVARHHLAVARFDKADLEPAARDDVGGRVFLGDPHRVGAHRDQRAEAEDAHLLGLPREDAEDHRARAVEAVDPGMVLDRDDVDAEIVAQQVLVEAFLEQIGGDLRVAIFVGQAGAHRVGAVEHLLRHKGIDVLAMIPGLHGGYSSRKRRTRSAKASGCSISGWCPARFDQLEARARDQAAVGAAVIRRHDPVARPPQHRVGTLIRPSQRGSCGLYM